MEDLHENSLFVCVLLERVMFKETCLHGNSAVSRVSGGSLTAKALRPTHTVTELPRVPVFIC